jgi:hypothetical protein
MAMPSGVEVEQAQVLMGCFSSEERLWARLEASYIVKQPDLAQCACLSVWYFRPSCFVSDVYPKPRILGKRGRFALFFLCAA